MLKNHKGNRDAIPVQQENNQEEREAESFAAAEPKLRIQSGKPFKKIRKGRQKNLLVQIRKFGSKGAQLSP